ncbi:hypothetical protein FG93_01940 [Bosea sp. LC85]|uniref:hypothetical protein n=1 Tax=Bosea sp. LC85 TaxID=1502851 RepID=UPI0004E29E5A|nr:hypothetical protein [Bosea sp. LC85]KFC73196.1 hypothetical protein FG93_01940 [Bosea sp. LC85]
MTAQLEAAVREAASALRAAIAAAEAAGLTVALPRRAADLGAIAISATGRARESWPVAVMMPPAPIEAARDPGRPLRLPSTKERRKR